MARPSVPGASGQAGRAGQAGRSASSGPAGPAPADRPGAPGGARRAALSDLADQRVNPALDGYLRDGAGLFRRFNRFGPERVRRITHCRVMPPVVVELGRLVGLIYRSDKWQAGRPRTYIHVMRDPPSLASDVGGRQLFLVGGSYRVTPAGIEG
jgi:hypothetical protein